MKMKMKRNESWSDSEERKNGNVKDNVQSKR